MAERALQRRDTAAEACTDLPSPSSQDTVERHTRMAVAMHFQDTKGYIVGWVPRTRARGEDESRRKQGSPGAFGTKEGRNEFGSVESFHSLQL
jgi:hypothetical protein